ncbi:MAG: hypothetical protein ACOCXQ_03455, partial [Patescibacteria group bacterium]
MVDVKSLLKRLLTGKQRSHLWLERSVRPFITNAVGSGRSASSYELRELQYLYFKYLVQPTNQFPVGGAQFLCEVSNEHRMLTEHQPQQLLGYVRKVWKKLPSD